MFRNQVPRLLKKIKNVSIQDDEGRYWCPVRKVEELVPDHPWGDWGPMHWCCWYSQQKPPVQGDPMRIGTGMYFLEEVLENTPDRKSRKMPTKAIVKFSPINS